RYGGEWPRERFRVHGLEYRLADISRSDLYLTLLPSINTPGQVELLDNKRMISQLCALNRPAGPNGKDSVYQPPSGRDDLINAAAIALVGVLKPLSGAEGWIEHYRRLSEKPPPGLGSDRVRVQVPAKLELSTIYGISGNAYCVEVGSDGRRTVIMPL